MTLLKLSPVRIERRRGGKPKHARRIDQCLAWLKTRQDVGVPTWEILAAGWTNPSQMHKDLVAEGIAVSKVDERPPNPTSNGQRGARFFLAEFAPDNATPVLARSAPRRRVDEPSSVAPAPKASVSADAGHVRADRPHAAPKKKKAKQPPEGVLSIFDGLDDGEPHHPEERKAA